MRTAAAGTGPALFARYALPPNDLGFCGPADPAELAGAALADDRRALSALARQFEGAWPYLELIAGCNGVSDPLDARVVEAYWVGNRLLERVPAGVLAAHLDARFGRRAGPDRAGLLGQVGPEGLAHHSFHVFAVYPWVGMLRSGRSEAPLRVLERCRIRWGRVEACHGGVATVRCRGLRFDGSRLGPGDPYVEEVRLHPGAGGADPPLVPGNVVSLHWDWVCDRLSPGALHRLRTCTERNLRLVNDAPAPGPAVACERGG